MQIVTEKHRTGTEIVFHANRPVTVKPKIVKQYNDGGKLMYMDSQGAIYFADLFDRMFKAPRMKVKPKHYKGSNNFKALKQ